jgi:hypothetical protein
VRVLDIVCAALGESTCPNLRFGFVSIIPMTDPELLKEVRAFLSPVLNYVWPSGRPENHDVAH